MKQMNTALGHNAEILNVAEVTHVVSSGFQNIKHYYTRYTKCLLFYWHSHVTRDFRFS
jgi:hypothetical protein